METIQHIIIGHVLSTHYNLIIKYAIYILHIIHNAVLKLEGFRQFSVLWLVWFINPRDLNNYALSVVRRHPALTLPSVHPPPSHRVKHRNFILICPHVPSICTSNINDSDLSILYLYTQKE